MRMIAVVFLLALTACAGNPRLEGIGDIPEVEPVQMPPLTGRYAEKAERLPDLTGADQQSQQRDAIDADMAYNDVAHRLNTVIDIYECVRRGINAGDADAVEDCLDDK